MKKVRLAPRRVQLPLGGERAKTLRPSVSIEAAYAAQWADLVERMHKEAVATVRNEFGSDVATGMDAPGDVWDRLTKRLGSIFEKAASSLAHGMIKRLDRNSDTGLKRSLSEVGEGLTLKMKNPADLQSTIDEHIESNVYYIKRIPKQYLDAVRDDVNASIANGGNGLQDLIPAMEKRYGEAKRHARNVALDQTRKAYTAINTQRMKSAGIRKFEWVHTGGSRDPRKYHMTSASSGGLNGGVFEIDNPPIIDERTGERGLPGQAPFCRCTMRPIVSFAEEE